MQMYKRRPTVSCKLAHNLHSTSTDTFLQITLAREVMSICLFPLYLWNWLTADLELSQVSSSQGTEGPPSRSRARQANVAVCFLILRVAFSARTLLFGGKKSIWPVKNWLTRCLHGYLFGARCKWLAYGPADATATPSSLALVKSRMVYPSGTDLSRLLTDRICGVVILHVNQQCLLTILCQLFQTTAARQLTVTWQHVSHWDLCHCCNVLQFNMTYNLQYFINNDCVFRLLT